MRRPGSESTRLDRRAPKDLFSPRGTGGRVRDHLEDRVRVLERIVTDKGYDVATQIEALRDQRSVEEHGSGVPLGIKQGEQAL